MLEKLSPDKTRVIYYTHINNPIPSGSAEFNAHTVFEFLVAGFLVTLNLRYYVMD